MTGARSRRIVAVIVTRDRAFELTRCLAAIARQDRVPDLVLVIDNAGEHRVDALVASHDFARLVRLNDNLGPAAAFGVGIGIALRERADFVWMMDDDGVPGEPACLGRLLATALREQALLVSPLVRDIACPARLAFPIRQRGRSRFTAAALSGPELIEGFAHLFNGALVAREAFETIGLPDASLFIRGDEVDFLQRLLRAGLRVLTDRSAAFLHPSSQPEIRSLCFDLLYAVVPATETKRFYQFRNRGLIFRRYSMWGWLAADHVRYAWYYLLLERDAGAFAFWLRTTWLGVRGQPGRAAPALPVSDHLQAEAGHIGRAQVGSEGLLPGLPDVQPARLDEAA